MPWNIKSSNQMRSEFIKLVSQPEISMAEACRSFYISRKSRRPVNQPTKLSEKVLLRIVSVRVAHKHWGADKIRAILKREHISPLPGRTTIHRVLRQAGLINLSRKRIPGLDNLRLVQDGGADLQVARRKLPPPPPSFRGSLLCRIRNACGIDFSDAVSELVQLKILVCM